MRCKYNTEAKLRKERKVEERKEKKEKKDKELNLNHFYQNTTILEKYVLFLFFKTANPQNITLFTEKNKVYMCY